MSNVHNTTHTYLRTIRSVITVSAQCTVCTCGYAIEEAQLTCVLFTGEILVRILILSRVARV